MRRPQEIDTDVQTMNSIVQLTGAFEGIASAHIARIKDQVKQSELYFADLWQVYIKLRVGKEFHLSHISRDAVVKKDLIIVVTAEGSLSGDIDKRVIDTMLESYAHARQDIVVIGHHGVTLLNQRKIKVLDSIRLPSQDGTGASDKGIERVLAYVQQYQSTVVYYQAYVSLMRQEIKNISLSAAIQERGDEISEKETDAYISDKNYIFEPSVAEVITHMERSMLGVALNEVMIESKLAQQASRFRAMSAARIKAKESQSELVRQYNYAGRALKDERTREIINSLRRGRVSI